MSVLKPGRSETGGEIAGVGIDILELGLGALRHHQAVRKP